MIRLSDPTIPTEQNDFSGCHQQVENVRLSLHEHLFLGKNGGMGTDKPGRIEAGRDGRVSGVEVRGRSSEWLTWVGSCW